VELETEGNCPSGKNLSQGAGSGVWLGWTRYGAKHGLAAGGSWTGRETGQVD